MSKFSFNLNIKRFVTQILLGLTTLSMLICVLYVSGFASPMMIDSAAMAQVPEREQALDAATYYAIDRLRNEIGLTNRDLCAAGCDTATTNGALTNLLAWYQSNKSSLYAARNADLAARKRLNEASHKNSEAEIRALANSVTKAREALAAVHAEAAGSADTALTQSQRERLSAARVNKEMAGVIRYVPGLSDTQRKALLDAQSTGSDSKSLLSAARLSSSQRQAMADVRTDLNAHSMEVAAGEQLALPIPPEVQAELELEQAWQAEASDVEPVRER